MASIRLPLDYEKKLKHISINKNITKSEAIKEALKKYFDDYDLKIKPYELGKDLFGIYGSGKGNFSQDYKKIVKEKIRAKHSR